MRKTLREREWRRPGSANYGSATTELIYLTLSESSKLRVEAHTCLFQLGLTRCVVTSLIEERGIVKVIATIKNGNRSYFGFIAPANLIFGLHTERLLYEKNYRM